MGSVGPIGYPGPKGLKVRAQPSCGSSSPSAAEVAIILFFPWVVMTVLTERWAAVMLAHNIPLAVSREIEGLFPAHLQPTKSV